MNKNPYKGSKILLVEDEESMAVGLEFNLSEEGYQVEWARDGREAMQFFESNVYDLVILDIMLPFLDGFEIAEKFRKRLPQLPILILTAKTHDKDRLHGLEIGADDYITKPFHLQELLLRVRGMLKRKQWYSSLTASQPIFKFGANEIDFNDLSCHNGKENFQLTPREAMILRYLIEREGNIVSRKELLENVWQVDADIETRTVDNFIARLRKYFEPDPQHPIYIKSVRGAGYIFNSDTDTKRGN